MKLTATFSEDDLSFDVDMPRVQDAKPFDFEFHNVEVIERTDIPSRYGLVTYDNTRTITVS